MMSLMTRLVVCVFGVVENPHCIVSVVTGWPVQLVLEHNAFHVLSVPTQKVLSMFLYVCGINDFELLVVFLIILLVHFLVEAEGSVIKLTLKFLVNEQRHACES